MLRVALIALVALATGFACGWADARPQYLREFGEVYPEVVGLAKEAKCSVCHCGESKKDHNDYGAAVDSVLKAKNVKVREQVRQALRDAERLSSSVPEKTFGDLIREKKLPGVCPPPKP